MDQFMQSRRTRLSAQKENLSLTNFEMQFAEDQLRSEIVSINTHLKSYGLGEIGDLSTHKLSDYQKTLKTIMSLLHQRNRDLDLRNQTVARIRKLQSQKNGLNQQIEKLTREKKEVERDKQGLQYKLKQQERTHKEASDKLTLQKEQLTKNLRGVATKEAQYNNQIKKRENTIQQLKELTTKKMSFSFCNDFSLSEKNIEKDTALATDSVKATLQVLSSQNCILREHLANLSREVTQIINLKRECLKLSGTSQQQSFQQGIQRGLFNQPFPSMQQTMRVLQENTGSLKKIVLRENKEGQEWNQSGDVKFKNLKNLRNLIKNYKTVIDSQDAMINKVIQKSKELRTAEALQLQTKLSKLVDDDQFESAKEVIRQQRAFIDSKNEELTQTKTLVLAALKRMQQQRTQNSLRRKQLQQSAAKFRQRLSQIRGRAMQLQR